MVQYDSTVRCDTIVYHTIYFIVRTVRYGRMRYDTIRCDTVQHVKVPYHTIPYHTIWYHLLSLQGHLYWIISWSSTDDKKKHTYYTIKHINLLTHDFTYTQLFFSCTFLVITRYRHYVMKWFLCIWSILVLGALGCHYERGRGAV